MNAGFNQIMKSSAFKLLNADDFIAVIAESGHFYTCVARGHLISIKETQDNYVLRLSDFSSNKVDVYVAKSAWNMYVFIYSELKDKV